MRPFLYVPKDLDLEQRLIQKGVIHPRNPRIFVEKCNYLIDHLYMQRVYWDKDPEKYTPISSEKLHRILGKTFGTDVKRCLVQAGIIEKSPLKHVAGHRCKAYRFTKEFQKASFVAKEISSASLLKKIKGDRDETTKRVIEGGHSGINLISHSLKRLQFDAIKAKIHLTGTVLMDEDSKNRADRFYYWLSNGIHFWLSDDSQGRIYHILAFVPRDMRRFVTFEGKALYTVDVSSSQPALLSSLYPEESPEKQKYVNLIKNGQLYSFLNDCSDGWFDMDNETEKGFFKAGVFREICYGSNYGGLTPLKEAFWREFPILSELIEKEKLTHHRHLPIRFQREEAELVIGEVAKQFSDAHNGENVCLISLHDCLITTEEHTQEIQKMLMAAYERKLGFAPQVKITQMSDCSAADFKAAA